MILLTPCFRPSPTQPDAMPLHGARARGDRTSITRLCVVNGLVHPLSPIATEAAALLPFNVIGDGCPERATQRRVIGVRSISNTSNLLVKDLPCRDRDTHLVVEHGGDSYPPVAAVTTLTVIPRVAFIGAKKDTKGFPAMAQTMGQHHDLAEEAAVLEQRLKERATAPDSPGGVHTTPAELADIQLAKRHRLRAEKAAISVYFGNKVSKLGLDAPSVIREIRDLYPNFDDAA